MTVVTITEAKNKLSALIDRVRGGDEVLISDRGIPVARLLSAVQPGEDAEGRIARLERAGIVRASRTRLQGKLLASEPPSLRKGASAVQVLLEERHSGR